MNSADVELFKLHTRLDRHYLLPLVRHSFLAMDIAKFNKDYEDYKNKLSTKLNEQTVNLMMHSFCMGYCQLSTELNEEFGAYIDLNPILEKISELAPKIKDCFE